MAVDKLNKITLHWTAGTYIPNTTDKKAYHFLVDGNGKVVKGKYKPEDNLDCSKKYAAHCGGGNTGNIGVALCCMWTSKDYPILRKQIEAACKLIAELSKKYDIPITNKTILTHSEFGAMNPHTTSYGKIDIDSIPCVAVYGRANVGRWIRNKVAWYRSKIID